MESIPTDPQLQVSFAITLDSNVDSDFGSWILMSHRCSKAHGYRPGLHASHVTPDVATTDNIAPSNSQDLPS